MIITKIEKFDNTFNVYVDVTGIKQGYSFRIDEFKDKGEFIKKLKYSVECQLKINSLNSSKLDINLIKAGDAIA